MDARHVSAIILSIVALPFIVLGLIDPLEGGIALLVAVGIGVVARVLSRVPFSRLTWIPMVTSIGIGVLVLVLAIVPSLFIERTGEVAANPVNAGVIALLWAYRVSVLVTLVGAVMYVVRLVRTARVPGPLRSGGPALPRENT
jgi:hypothetical protein